MLPADERGAFAANRENEHRPGPGISEAVAAHSQRIRQKAEISSAGYMRGRRPDTLPGVTEKRLLFLHPGNPKLATPNGRRVALPIDDDRWRADLRTRRSHARSHGESQARGVAKSTGYAIKPAH
jgi:hypothetical protein